MACIKCSSDRIFSFDASHDDRFCCSFKGERKVEADYAPYIQGICGGDDTGFSLCLECGQVQDNFPKEFPEENEDY